MKKFYAEYKDDELVQHLVAQVPWGHNVVLMDKISNFENRLASSQSELAVQTMKKP